MKGCNWVNLEPKFCLFLVVLHYINQQKPYFRTILLCIKTKRDSLNKLLHPLLLMDKIWEAWQKFFANLTSYLATCFSDVKKFNRQFYFNRPKYRWQIQAKVLILSYLYIFAGPNIQSLKYARLDFLLKRQTVT